MTDMTRAYVQSATWYWDTLGETNQHVIDYMKSLTAIMCQPNPMAVLTPMLREENRAAATLAARTQEAQRNGEQASRRSEEAVESHRKAAAPKATRRNATSARNGRRSK